MEPKRKHLHAAGDEDVGTAVFNVGGRHFEVLKQTIEACPTTLLASLLEDIGTDSERPIFVDANPDRFAHILDWYRYGEMFTGESCPVGGLISDARFFLLPDSITINGSSHDIRPGAPNAAYVAGVSAVKKHWPGFGKCMDSLLAEIQSGLENLGEAAGRVQWPLAGNAKWAVGEIAEDPLLVTSIVLYDRNFMTRSSEQGACSMVRCRIIQSELTKRGYDCEISDRSPDPYFDDYYGGDPCLFLNVFWRCSGCSGGCSRERSVREMVELL